MTNPEQHLSAAQKIAGKLHAARTLYDMIRWFRNWDAVWSCYRRRSPLPPLEFRAGFVLHHGQWDDPMGLVYDAYAHGLYSRDLPRDLAGTMIDIGANIGLVSLEFAVRWKNLRIFAYEPNPSTNVLLRRNIEAGGFNGRVMVYGEAVGRCHGTLDLWTDVQSVAATGHSQVPPAADARSVQVPMIDLNEAVERAGANTIAMVKIDAEGAEADILESATQSTLAAFERVTLEYHEWLCQDALVRCRRVLEGADFKIRIQPSDRPDMGMLYAWRG